MLQFFILKVYVYDNHDVYDNHLIGWEWFSIFFFVGFAQNYLTELFGFAGRY